MGKMGTLGGGAQYANTARGTRWRNNAEFGSTGTFTAKYTIECGEEILIDYDGNSEKGKYWDVWGKRTGIGKCGWRCMLGVHPHPLPLPYPYRRYAMMMSDRVAAAIPEWGRIEPFEGAEYMQLKPELLLVL